jgi:ABC-2 type transport system ATP-binding protein
MNETNAISVREVKKHFPVMRGFRELFSHPFQKRKVTALNGVNLEVKPGQCFCLLGPNGAGKTTLMKILSTLVLPDEGKTFVNGFDVEKEPEGAKDSIGFAINEDRSFYWRLTGRQNLSFFASISGLNSLEGKKRVDEILNLTLLEDVADFRFNTYSTGMRQMMAFARALLTGPKILFVDEPTRSLDPQAAQKVRQFLREELVDNQGRTVFWATHNLIETQEYAHEIAIIDNGQIRIRGRVTDLTKNGNVPLKEIYEQAVNKNSPE